MASLFSTGIRAAFAALILGISLLNGAEIDLLSLLPEHCAVAGYIKADKLTAQTFFPHLEFAGVKQAAFGCDARGRRIAVLFQFAEKTSWQKMWDHLSPYLEPLPAERRIMLFKVKDIDTFYRNGHFAVLAPMTAAFYADFPKNQPFRCNYSGVPQSLRQNIPSGMPLAAAGIPRIKEDPFRQIRAFDIKLTNVQNQPVLTGKITCKQPFHASLTHVALLGTCSFWLQEYAGLTPEAAAGIIALIKVRQHKNILHFEFKDFALLEKMLREHTVR